MFVAVGIPEGPSVAWDYGAVLEDCAEVDLRADSSCIVGQAASIQIRQCTFWVWSVCTPLVHDCSRLDDHILLDWAYYHMIPKALMDPLVEFPIRKLVV